MATQNPNPVKSSKPQTAKPQPGKTQAASAIKTFTPLLEKENFYIIGVGVLLLLIGYILMAGGNQKPTEWNVTEIYSFRRINISTIVVISGYVVIGFGLMMRLKGRDTANSPK